MVVIRFQLLAQSLSGSTINPSAKIEAAAAFRAYSQELEGFQVSYLALHSTNSSGPK